MKIFGNFIRRVFVISILSYLGLLGFLYFFQESLLFMPVKLSEDYTFTLPDVEEVEINVPGAKLSALHYTLPDPEGVVFFLHGNSGSLANWLTDTSFYKKINYDLFMLDYRGFGKSTGYISSQEELLNDIKISWDYVESRYEEKKKVIYGRSLGTALAAGLSAETSPDLTILVSPYYNMSEMAELYYPWVPNFLLRYPLDTANYLRNINNPVLIFHGSNDELIPLSHSRRLKQENALAKLIVVPKAQHDDIHVYHQYYDSLDVALTKIIHEPRH